MTLSFLILTMMASIDDFSPEIIALIVEHLEIDELFNFRLATRYLAACSRPIFIQRYFHKRHHLLTRGSLVTLLEISRNPIFGPCIQEIHISTKHYIPRRTLPISAASVSQLSWLSSPHGVITEIGKKNYLFEQDWFQKSGLDTTYLTQILQNASNCHTIVLAGEQRPWGAGIPDRKAGDFPRISRALAMRAIHVLIAAIAASKAQITTLELNGNFDAPHIETSMLRLPGFCLDNDIPWITSLNKLNLAVGPHAGGNPDIWAEPLCNFITKFPRLEILRLEFPFSVEQKEFAALSRMLTLPKIRTLELSSVYCLSDDLLSFLYKHHSTLQAVALVMVVIDTRNGGSWQSVLAAIRDNFHLVSFRMALCHTDSDPMWFGEGDRDISNDVLVKGGDSRLFDSLINGLRRRSDKDYIIKPGTHIIT